MLFNHQFYLFSNPYFRNCKCETLFVFLPAGLPVNQPAEPIKHRVQSSSKGLNDGMKTCIRHLVQNKIISVSAICRHFNTFNRCPYNRHYKNGWKANISDHFDAIHRDLLFAA